MFNSALLSTQIYAGKNLPPGEGLSGGWVPLGKGCSLMDFTGSLRPKGYFQNGSV